MKKTGVKDMTGIEIKEHDVITIWHGENLADGITQSYVVFEDNDFYLPFADGYELLSDIKPDHMMISTPGQDA